MTDSSISTPISSDSVEISTVFNYSNPSQSVSGLIPFISHEDEKSLDVTDGLLKSDDFLSDDIGTGESSYKANEEAILLKMFNEAVSQRKSANKKHLEAKNNFIPIRDCYGVVDDLKDGFFKAKIYNNLTNEFVEVIKAPLNVFSKSDLELLIEGSVFYWKAGYRSSDQGTRHRVNDFNIRRVVRDISKIRQKRINNVVEELYSIFK